jgi:uncharacterized membrane protein YphA (DoxX/SURF4 family)
MATLSNGPKGGWWRNGWLEFVLRGLLGGLFVLASLHKIGDPASFAKIVYGYDLFPGATVNLIAIFLPFLELTAGLALVTGIYPRASAVILSGLLLSFIVVIGINAIRGHVFDCGCFAAGEAALWANSPGWLLGRNILLLAVGAYIITFPGPRKIQLRAG